MFGFLFKNNPGDKHTFTTRRGKKKAATINQVLKMPTMWSDDSIRKAQSMAGGVAGNPRTFGGAVSPRDKARRAQAQQARAHRAALEKHYMSEGLSEEEALEQHAIDQSMRREHYRGLRTASNPVRLARANPIRLLRTNPGGKSMNARYGGKCKMTGEEYEPGAQITKVDGVGWCLAKNV
jgi:hypothetical protein